MGFSVCSKDRFYVYWRHANYKKRSGLKKLRGTPLILGQIWKRGPLKSYQRFIEFVPTTVLSHESSALDNIFFIAWF